MPRIFGTSLALGAADADALSTLTETEADSLSALAPALGALHETDALYRGAEDAAVAVPLTLTGVGVGTDEEKAVPLACALLKGVPVALVCTMGPLLVLGAYHQSVVTPTGKVYFACYVGCLV